MKNTIISIYYYYSIIPTHPHSSPLKATQIMNIQQKLTEIQQTGITLSLNGHNIACKPKRKLTRDMALWLTANKPAVLKILNTEHEQKRQLVYEMVTAFIKAGIHTEAAKIETDRLLADDDYLALISVNELQALIDESTNML